MRFITKETKSKTKIFHDWPRHLQKYARKLNNNGEWLDPISRSGRLTIATKELQPKFGSESLVFAGLAAISLNYCTNLVSANYSLCKKMLFVCFVFLSLTAETCNFPFTSKLQNSSCSPSKLATGSFDPWSQTCAGISWCLSWYSERWNKYILTEKINRSTIPLRTGSHK